MEFIRSLITWFGFGRKESIIFPEESDSDVDKCRKQMNFYFSASNLEKDARLRAMIENGEQKFVKIVELQKFPRIKSSNYSVETILEACSTSQDLEVDIERMAVRAKAPFVPDPRRFCRIVRISGFDESDSSIDSIWKCVSPYCQDLIRIEPIVVARNGSKFFNGNIDLEFSTEQAASKFASRAFPYKGSKIQPLLFSDHIERIQHKKKAKIPREPTHFPRYVGRSTQRIPHYK